MILELSGINKTYLDYREENLLVEGLRGLEGRRDRAGVGLEGELYPLKYHEKPIPNNVLKCYLTYI